MAAQIACGMSYLVRREVFHKDLAPRISVIDDNFNLRAKPIPLQSLVPHGLSLSGEQQKRGIDGWLLKVWLIMSSPAFPSLVIQWLRLHTPTAGAWVRSLVGELDPACHN